jgi:hypothetical protein
MRLWSAVECVWAGLELPPLPAGACVTGQHISACVLDKVMSRHGLLWGGMQTAALA